MHLWLLKTYYDSRFVIMDDLYHRFYEVAYLAALASSVVHIRPIESMSQPSQNLDPFCFYLSVSVAQLLYLLRYVELAGVGRGEREAIRAQCYRNGKMGCTCLVLQVTAAVIAGIDYHQHTSSSHRLLAGAEEANDSDRIVNQIPIWLNLMGPVSNWFINSLKVIFFFPSDGTHKQQCKFVVQGWISNPRSYRVLFLPAILLCCQSFP
jgi:hypothetical protein